MADQPFTLLYDASGQPVTSAFAPVTGRPGVAAYSPAGGITQLGQDYASPAKSQVPKVDATGNQYVVTQNAGGGNAYLQATSTVASQASVYGPVVMGLQSATVTPLQLDALGNLVTIDDMLPTFSVIASGVAVTTGKSMLELVNKSTTGSIVRVVQVISQNSSQTTGGLLTAYSLVAFELRPITSVSATGTTLSPLPFDSADTLDASISCYTGATVTGDTKGAYRRWVTSNDGWTAGGAQQEHVTGDQQGRNPWVTKADINAKHVTVRPGAGVHVKTASTSTQGYQDVTFIFTVSTT